MSACPWSGDDRLRCATVHGARWLADLQLWRPNEPDAATTGAVETAVVLLGGTFDLVANGTAWPARGARSTPFAGRPMAVFLPPSTEFRVANGPADRSGELLLIAARQPELPEPAAGREGLSRKPLLPLAGSGKAFDPTSGDWRPAETFVTAAESLPPRRIERLSAGGIAIERVFPAGYKALTLSVDEAIVPAGGVLRLADVPARPASDELLVFVRAESTARLMHPDDTGTIVGNSVHWFAADRAADLEVHAYDGASYVVLAYAGKR